MTRRLRPAFILGAAALLAACQYFPAGGSSSAAGGKAGNTPSASGAPERQARAQATPSPASWFRPAPLVLEAGTVLPVELRTTISSASSNAGDLVVARLLEDVRVGSRVVLPEGSELRGRVTAAVPSGRVKGRARLAFRFESVEVKGRTYDIQTDAVDITAKATHKKDAALIGGGALIGGLAKGKKGAGIGALVGGGAVLATKGKEIELSSGAQLHLKLAREARLAL